MNKDLDLFHKTDQDIKNLQNHEKFTHKSTKITRMSFKKKNITILFNAHK